MIQSVVEERAIKTAEGFVCLAVKESVSAATEMVENKIVTVKGNIK